MNRFFAFIAASCLILLLTACGYRTAPVPYSEPDKKLPVISGASLTQRGHDWVFRWQVPGKIQWAGNRQETLSGSKSTEPENPEEQQVGAAEKTPLISRFTIDIYQRGNSCPACQAVKSGSLMVAPPGGQVTYAGEMTLTVPLANSRFYARPGNRFSLVIPSVFFAGNRLADTSYFTIDYTLESGLLSIPSARLDNLNLKPVPKPRLTVHKSVRRQKGEDTRPEYFLVLEWQPRQETIHHTLQQDGRIAETVVHYGLNLYRSDSSAPRSDGVQGDAALRRPETRINSAPLLNGRFSLLNFQGRLTARQVDRFGNESESITVFDGRY